MRPYLFTTGLLLLIFGILMVLFLWPIIGFETMDTFNSEDIKSEETVRYVGKITNILKTGDIYTLELDGGVLDAYTKESTYELNERVQVTITFGDNTTNWDENSYLVEKIPTTFGFLGIILFFFGLLIMSVGAVTKKLTLEDVVQFTVEPRKRTIAQTQLHSSPQTDEKSKVAAPNASNAQMENVTCPKCGNIFSVVTSPKPTHITCPKCGIKGKLD